MYPHIRATKLARIKAESEAGSDTRFIALFNDSAGAELLVVRDFTLRMAGETDPIAFFLSLNSKPGDHFAYGTYILTGESRPPGETRIGTVTSNAYDWFTSSVSDTVPVWWAHEYPIAILKPGWSLVVYADSPAQDIDGAFIYQVCTPEELDVCDANEGPRDLR